MNRHDRRVAAAKARKNAEPVPLAPGRECGACTACCTVTEITQLRKPAGERCPHQHAGGVGIAPGCDIYAKRPSACRGYFCAWRIGVGRDDERPDQVGYVLQWSEDNAQRTDTEFTQAPTLAEKFRRAWLSALDFRPGASAEAADRLRELAEERGGAIALEVEDGTAVVGPQADYLTRAHYEGVRRDPRRRLQVVP